MLGRSVTFRPESIEKRSQRGTLKNLTTPIGGDVFLLLQRFFKESHHFLQICHFLHELSHFGKNRTYNRYSSVALVICMNGATKIRPAP